METFLVRVWTPADGEALQRLCGHVLHVPSGRTLTFTHAGSLVRFLADATSHPVPERVPRPTWPSTGGDEGG